MEFILLAVAILFLIPFPAKWKFVWQLRFLGLAVLALTGGITVSQMFGLTGQIGGVLLMLTSVVFLYLALRYKRPVRRAAGEKK
jgi:hypothetical protein